MRFLAVPFVVALLAFSAPEAHAQTTSGTGSAPAPGVPPSKRKGDGGPVYAPPEDGKPPEKEKEGDRPQKPQEPPKSDIERFVASLASWPSPESRGAVDALTARWAEAKPALLAALTRVPVDGHVAAGAAVAFRKAADPEGVPVFVAILRDPKCFRWAPELLEAVVSLDPVGARERLLDLLSVPSALVVDRVARALQPLLGPTDVPRLLELATAKFSGTRRAALGLASEADFAAARPALLVALGDPSPDVAITAAVTLGTRADEAGAAELNVAARGTDPRRGAYATLALMVAGEGKGVPVLEEATVSALLGSRGLRAADPLVRTTAAMALADFGFLKPDPSVDPLLEREIVPTLLDVVAGTRFFSDLAALKPFVLSRLRRLCPGTERFQTAPEWAEWWDARRGTFVARRALNAIPPAVRGNLVVRVEGDGAGAALGVFSTSAAEAPPSGGAGGRFTAISRDEANRIAEAIEAAGVLAIPEAILLGDEKPSLEIAVEAGNRGRTARIGPGVAVPASVAPVLELLAKIREENRWQRYWDHRTAPTFAVFVELERPNWLPGMRGANERADRIVRLAVAALPDMAEEDRVATLTVLRADPVLKRALRPEDASVLASFAAVGERLSPSGEAALRTLAAAGRTDGLSTIRARLEAAASDADRGLFRGLLEETFLRAPFGAVVDAADKGSTVQVRAAALRALGGREGAKDEETVKVVRRATTDEDAAVRAAAYVALGSLRTDDALTLLQFGSEQESDVGAKGGALEGLGRLGGPAVVPILGKATQSSDPRIRAAAVRGLASCREPEALTFVLTLLVNDPEAAVREEADHALRETGGDRAREALRTVANDRRQAAGTRLRAVEGLGVLGAAASVADLRALLSDPEPDVADAAAFALAWIRDGEAAPRLLDALRAGRSPARTLQCLELLSLEEFGRSRERSEAAALYAGWFEMTRERGPRGWLAEALTTRGYVDASIEEFVSGANPRAAAAGLVKAFRERSWAIRRAANLELERIAGKKFGDIDPWTSEEKVAAVAAAWNEWWEKERGAER
jgi:HEAT repeat protein